MFRIIEAERKKIEAMTKEQMVSYWGHRCPDYEPHCCACAAWQVWENKEVLNRAEAHKAEMKRPKTVTKAAWAAMSDTEREFVIKHEAMHEHARKLSGYGIHYNGCYIVPTKDYQKFLTLAESMPINEAILAVDTPEPAPKKLVTRLDQMEEIDWVMLRCAHEMITDINEHTNTEEKQRISAWLCDHYTVEVRGRAFDLIQQDRNQSCPK